VARAILQRGLQINPDSGCLAQAWGLMELQKGNAWAAVRLVSEITVAARHRCVEFGLYPSECLTSTSMAQHAGFICAHSGIHQMY
jgi:hypothetical protein